MWTLIVVSVFFGYQGEAGTLSVDNIPGFSTQQACNNAGNAIVAIKPVDQRYTETRISFTCVSKDV